MDANADREDVFRVLLVFLKALADESRLKIVGSLAASDRSVEELAAMLSVRPPTVSHHLALLREAGLVTVRPEGNSRIYRLEASALRRLARLLDLRRTVPAMALPDVGDAWERKVLADFFVGERLKEIPASRKKREVILRFLATKFEPGRRYPEAQVNERLKRHHPDVATLRRELICSRLLVRENSVYWKPEPA